MASSDAVQVVVLQHMDAGHPWYLRELLRETAASVVTLRPDADAAGLYPSIGSFDALWVMGGAMQVWQEAEHPWLVEEKRFIREVVRAGVPYLGVCLGHQLLAEALGGRVREAPQPEIGLFPVSLTAAGAASIWFAGCDAGPRLQWHKAEVEVPPDGAKVLAHSERCAVQAMALGPSALSLQYHVEAEAEMLPTWCRSASAHATLDEAFGVQRGRGEGESGDEGGSEGTGLARFQAQTLRRLPTLQAHARQLFRNWAAAAGCLGVR